MKIEIWELIRMQPNDKTRRQNDQAVENIAQSSREFGFKQPIVMDTAGWSLSVACARRLTRSWARYRSV